MVRDGGKKKKKKSDGGSAFFFFFRRIFCFLALFWLCNEENKRTFVTSQKCLQWVGWRERREKEWAVSAEKVVRWLESTTKQHNKKKTDEGARRLNDLRFPRPLLLFLSLFIPFHSLFSFLSSLVKHYPPKPHKAYYDWQQPDNNSRQIRTMHFSLEKIATPVLKRNSLRAKDKGYGSIIPARMSYFFFAPPHNRH